VWHVPRSNWMRRESTGTNFTLKLATSGMTSVGRARFKSPLAHVSDWPRVFGSGASSFRDDSLWPAGRLHGVGCRRRFGVGLLGRVGSVVSVT
jgi:hypothetical protein